MNIQHCDLNLRANVVHIELWPNRRVKCIIMSPIPRDLSVQRYQFKIEDTICLDMDTDFYGCMLQWGDDRHRQFINQTGYCYLTFLSNRTDRDIGVYESAIWRTSEYINLAVNMQRTLVFTKIPGRKVSIDIIYDL